jgi:hypothetical protein
MPRASGHVRPLSPDSSLDPQSIGYPSTRHGRTRPALRSPRSSPTRSRARGARPGTQLISTALARCHRVRASVREHGSLSATACGRTSCGAGLRHRVRRAGSSWGGEIGRKGARCTGFCVVHFLRHPSCSAPYTRYGIAPAGHAGRARIPTKNTGMTDHPASDAGPSSCRPWRAC